MTTTSTTIEEKAVLVTGANRGLGRALVEEALLRGAARVYAGARQPFTHPDARVTPLTLTSPIRRRSRWPSSRSNRSTS
jgi:NAD(P)-dependent dehydrogenase (short-subunit alcohol dehydrogenase family)